MDTLTGGDVQSVKMKNFPFQVTAFVHAGEGESDSKDGCIIAASDSKLYCLDLESGRIVSEWPENQVQAHPDQAPENEQDDRPTKKQKLSNDSKTQAPKIIKIAVSSSNEFLAAVTDDKVVHTFRINAEGHLSPLSARTMPKRPCAIQIINNTTILCGDKFGDVYSLPLIIRSTSTSDFPSNPGPEPTHTPEPAFKPSATPLTVHTQRNRRALNAQLAQKNFTPRKNGEPLKFEHTLLLGHVSMLTHLLYTSIQFSWLANPVDAGYIITTDRDEHIRISRGPPQAYVIEGYCLGHTEYVSKVCVGGEKGELLISGGGDDWVGVWEWFDFEERKVEGLLRRKADLKQKVRKVLNKGEGEEVKVNVSGMWLVGGKVLIIAVEKVPALFWMDGNQLLVEGVGFTTLRLEAPLLDVVSAGSDAQDPVIVSLDNREGASRLRAFKIASEGKAITLKEDDKCQSRLQALNDISTDTDIQDKQLDDFLYNIANLRKRSGDSGEAGDEDAPADD